MSVLLQVSFANIFTACGLLLIALSFATDRWLEYTVNRSALIKVAGTNSQLNTSLYTDPLYFTRYRGLFRTCYEGKEVYNFIDKLTNVVDGTCVTELGYEINRREETLSYGSDYETRIHLMRAHFGFFVVSILLLVVGSILGAVSCWNKSSRLLRTTGLVVFLGAFLTASGMALFHGYEYLENEKIEQMEFPKKWRQVTWLNSENVLVSYGYSYILGWIGMAMTTIAAIVFLCAAYTAQAAKYREKHPFDQDYTQSQSGHSGRPRNKAYDYMDQNQFNKQVQQGYDYGTYPTMPGPGSGHMSAGGGHLGAGGGHLGYPYPSVDYDYGGRY